MVIKTMNAITGSYKGYVPEYRLTELEGMGLTTIRKAHPHTQVLASIAMLIEDHFKRAQLVLDQALIDVTKEDPVHEYAKLLYRMVRFETARDALDDFYESAEENYFRDDRKAYLTLIEDFRQTYHRVARKMAEKGILSGQVRQ